MNLAMLPTRLKAWPFPPDHVLLRNVKEYIETQDVAMLLSPVKI